MWPQWPWLTLIFNPPWVMIMIHTQQSSRSKIRWFKSWDGNRWMDGQTEGHDKSSILSLTRSIIMCTNANSLWIISRQLEKPVTVLHGIKKLLIYTHTHTCLTAHCLGLPGSASTRKVKPIWILLEQETVSGSGISWATCKSASRSRQTTTPAPHHSVFTGRVPFLPPNHVKALKAYIYIYIYIWHTTHV